MLKYLTWNEQTGTFELDFPAGRDITVLQITDLQLQNYDGFRTELRRLQTHYVFFNGMSKSYDLRAWRYVDEAVQKTRPDLLVLTGDQVYGELDDSGALFDDLCRRLDAYRIPWLMTFGNHDNESAKGVLWQTERIRQSEYAVFDRGNVTGNSNYALLLRQGGKAKYLFYLLDSNGCKIRPRNDGEGMMPDNRDIDRIRQEDGFAHDQLVWIEETCRKVTESFGSLPTMMFFHIPVYESVLSIREKYPAYDPALFLPDKDGDSGMSREAHGGFYDPDFWPLVKRVNCRALILGHIHKIATDILYDGVRIIHGLKTGTYDYHSPDMLGTTRFILEENSGAFRTEYLFSALDYEENRDSSVH